MPTSHKFAVITRQKRHHIGNIIWAAESSKRGLCLQLLQPFRAPPVLEARSRVNDGSVNGINADAELTQLFRGSKCKTSESELAR